MFGALFLGGLIGLERQWRQRMTGLRTNGLVAVGSAMFIMMGLRGSRGYRHFEPRLTPNNKRRSGSRQLGAGGGGGPSNVCRAPALPSIDQKWKRLLSHEFDHSPIADWSLMVVNSLEVGNE